MNRWMLPRMVGEVVRTCPDADRAGAYITVTLSDTGGTRARGSALYRVGLAFSWRDDLGPVQLCTGAGVPVEWRFSDWAAWLEKSLGGWPVRVALDFKAERLSLPFTGLRLERHLNYMRSLKADELRAEAVALRAKWANLPIEAARRVACESRAAVLDSVADSLALVVPDEQGGGADA